jgi:RNA polymerase sigma-70 factor, ECF subfamily
MTNLISIRGGAARGSSEEQREKLDREDQALVEALLHGSAEAPTLLFDRYGKHVQKVLVNVMGIDPELPDLLHEVFARALGSIRSLREGARLKAWLTSIAIFTARGCIRSRSRRRFFGLSSSQEEAFIPVTTMDPEVREAMRAMYQVMERLPADERIAFTLRFVNGMELAEVAEACQVSLATIKRRLARAEKRFLLFARRHQALLPWIQEGSRWSQP